MSVYERNANEPSVLVVVSGEVDGDVSDASIAFSSTIA
jgi:hypothetical protein